MDKTLIIAILALLISGGSLLFTYLNFKRNRKLENENHIYKTKLEKYYLITEKITNVLKIIESGIDISEEYEKKQSPENLKPLEAAADDADEEVINFGYYLAANAIILPDKLLTLLTQFADLIIEVDIEDENKTTLNKIIDQCYDKSDQILIAMRNDLHVDQLNSSLFKRINK